MTSPAWAEEAEREANKAWDIICSEPESLMRGKGVGTILGALLSARTKGWNEGIEDAAKVADLRSSKWVGDKIRQLKRTEGV